MARLIYVSNVSLDGFVDDEHGGIDWAPGDDRFAFITHFVAPGRHPRSTGGACTRRLASAEDPHSYGQLVRLLSRAATDVRTFQPRPGTSLIAARSEARSSTSHSMGVSACTVAVRNRRGSH